MVKIVILCVCGCLLLGAGPAVSVEATPLSALVSNTEPLRIIASSADDPCRICASQELRKALALLNKTLRPGTIFTTSPDCRFEKNATTPVNELALSCRPNDTDAAGYPRLTFRFHTPNAKMVGIAAADLTDPQAAIDVRTCNEALFEGSVQVVAFAYGDGDGFLYSPNLYQIQIHCRILDLECLPK